MSQRRLFFDEAFDGGVYSGARTGATAGESWQGPLGALGTFESLLGLTHRPIGAGVRAGEALRGLTERSSEFWARSLEADGLATARELLRWHDTLRLQGWSGGGGKRLDALASAFKNVSPGPATRLERVIERLDLLRDVRFSLTTYADQRALPRRWREVFAAVASSTKRAEVQRSSHGAPALEAALKSGFTPDAGDSALQLIRPYGPLVAADAIAAALAASPSVPTVVIGSDPVLDAALYRYGLPTTGAAQTSHDNVLGELLPLIIELGLAPKDPQRALELLTIHGGPIRPKVARALQHALQKWPAVGSPAWVNAIERVVPLLEDSESKKVAKERLKDVFGASVTDSRAYPTEVLLERAAWMQQWLHGRLSHEASEAGQARLQAVMGQVALFSNLVDRASAQTLTMTQVRRFLEEAHDGMATVAAFPHQAGFHVVASPGGVVAPVERIVWWNYTRSSSPAPRGLGLSLAELSALAESNVVPPASAEVIRERAERALRPFKMATESLWLVCPRREVNGDEATPHPSWDEVVARLKEPRLVGRLVQSEPLLAKPVVRTKRVALALPAQVQDWKSGVAIARREQESPSSIDDALACSLKWALNYVAKLRSGATATLPTGDTVLGTLAHYVLLEKTLRVPHSSAEAAAEFAITTLREEGPSLAASLFLPGASAERGEVEHVLRGSARALHELVESGWHVTETEASRSGSAFGTGFGGSIDLLVERAGTHAVIDLKWSGQAYRRKSLEEGTALQLAAYAALLGQAGFANARVAYFILTSHTMLSADPGLATGGTEVNAAPTPAATWKLLEATHKIAWKSLAKGVLTSPGVVDDKHLPETGIEGGVLSMSPPCQFCEYGGICGRRYGRVEVSDGED